MSRIFTLGNEFYIESLISARASVAANTLSSRTLTLEIAGRFLCGVATLDMTGSDPDIMGLVSVALRNTNNSELTVNSQVALVEAAVANGSASAQTIGVKVILLMRK